MTQDQHLSRADLNVLFWIVGCRTGATFEEIFQHESHLHRQPPSQEAIRECLARLEARRLITLVGDRYRGDSKLQKAFLNECQNCQDTIEEIDILSRLIPSDE
jgi:hypothetical protein